jgi:pimeloyl-ACP methyl ester carboxylesterase
MRMRVELDDMTVFVHEYGQGSPIILLHAGPGLDGSIFFPWFERLKGHRLLAPDLRGHGRSDLGDPSGWTWSGWADDVARLAEALDLGAYTLLGHSFGARIALQHAVDLPGHAKRIVCSGGVAHAGALAHLEATFEEFGTPELRVKVEAAFDAEETVQTPEACHDIWTAQMPFFLADPDGPALREVADRWRDVRYSPQMHRIDPGVFDVRDRLADVNVPVLVITGAEDRITRPQESEEIAAALPDATLSIVEGAGHFPFIEAPERYLGVIGSWLREEGALPA